MARRKRKIGRPTSNNVVKQITPNLSSGLNQKKRVNQSQSSNFVQKVLSRARRRRLFIIGIIIVIAAIIAWFVGTFVFHFGINGRLALNDSGVESVLTKSKADKPYYTFLTADLDDKDGNKNQIDAAMLIRVDEQNKTISLLSLPYNTQVMLSDGKLHTLDNTVNDGGTSEAIKAAKSIFDLEISHYIHLDSTAVKTLMDKCGGIDVNLSEEVDDPSAGIIYIPAGNHTFVGEDAIVFLRAKNFSDGIIARANNQCVFTAAVLQKMFSMSNVEYSALFDAIAGDLKSDISLSGFDDLRNKLFKTEASKIQYGHVPGYENTQAGTTTFTVSASMLRQVVNLFEAGKTPVVEDNADTSNVVNSNVTITVRNGSGITGGAAMIAGILTDAGFNVVKTENADSYVYTETLIIYNSDAQETSAKAVQQCLGAGRVVDGSSFYTFDTNILVVLGGDWKVS